MDTKQKVRDIGAEEQEITIDLGRMFHSLLHFAWLIAIFAIVGAVVMFTYTEMFVTPKYKSTVSIYIHDKSVTGSTGEEGEIIDYNTGGTNVAEYLQNTYIRTLTSDITLNTVIDNLWLSYGSGELGSMISYSIEDYPVFDITVTSDDPYEAAEIANELAAVLFERVSKIVSGTTTTIIDDAVPSGSQASPNVMKNTFIGLFIGLLIGCAIVVVAELLDNRIYDDEYLTNKYGISVLASIIDHNSLVGGSGYGYGKYEHGKGD